MNVTEKEKIHNITAQTYLNHYRNKVVSADEAVKYIKSGDKILVHSNCAYPTSIVNAMMKRKDELFDVQIFHALAVGDLPYVKEDMKNHFRHNAFFAGPNTRKAVQDGLADFTPIFLSDIPKLFIEGIIKLDAALIHVTPPDEHGFCSLGVEVGLTKSGAERANLIIAQVNENMPRTLGDSFIHASKIDFFVEQNEEIKELPQTNEISDARLAEVYRKIGKNVASLVEDGSTLQLGIGAIPDSVLQFLYDKKDLGIHTELFSDSVIDLFEKDIINNKKKNINRNKIIAGFVLGSKKLYRFIHNNPAIEFHSQEYVNDPYVIAQNDKMVAINSAIEVDITGQVCADSIGTKIYSGFGGQLDFIRGAARSKGGKPIIALPSTTKDEKFSRIVAQLKPGAGVITGRGDVHYIVTEYGIAYLFGKNIRERVYELIKVAHPRHRDELLKYASENKFI